MGPTEAATQAHSLTLTLCIVDRTRHPSSSQRRRRRLLLLHSLTPSPPLIHTAPSYPTRTRRLSTKAKRTCGDPLSTCYHHAGQDGGDCAPRFVICASIAHLAPDFDDDDDFGLPSFASRAAFGQGSGSPDSDHSHRNDSISSDHSGLRPFGGSIPRSTIPKSTLAHSTSSSHVDLSSESPRLGRLPNGSSSSLGMHAPPQQASPGASLLASRKGSFASLKNILKPNQQGSIPAVPPVPAMDKSGRYPALQNPFRYDADPMSSSQPIGRPRANTKASITSTAPSFIMHHGSKQSVTTLHSSQRSHGGRSTTSQSSSNFRAEDHPMPPLSTIPNRSTPSRVGRPGSDTSMFGPFGRSEEQENFGKSPAEEALKLVYMAFRAAAESKIKKIMAKPLVGYERILRLPADAQNSHIALSSTLEAGVDPAFDTLIVSMANCTRRHARRVVDLLGMWVRTQSENALLDVRPYVSQSMGMPISTQEAVVTLGGRRASAGRYIYYRTLMEIIRVVPREQLGDDVALNLEHAAFSVFRSERTEDFVHRRAVSGLLVDFLSELSKIRFLTVSDRFTRELTGLTSGVVTKDTEAKIEHILKGVRKLNLRVGDSRGYTADLAGLSGERAGDGRRVYRDSIRVLRQRPRQHP